MLGLHSAGLPCPPLPGRPALGILEAPVAIPCLARGLHRPLAFLSPGPRQTPFPAPGASWASTICCLPRPLSLGLRTPAPREELPIPRRHVRLDVLTCRCLTHSRSQPPVVTIATCLSPPGLRAPACLGAGPPSSRRLQGTRTSRGFAVPSLPLASPTAPCCLSCSPPCSPVHPTPCPHRAQALPLQNLLHPLPF